VGFILEVQDAVFVQASHAAKEKLGLAPDQDRPAGGVRVHLFGRPIVDGQHLIASRLNQELSLQLVEFLRHLLR